MKCSIVFVLWVVVCSFALSLAAVAQRLPNEAVPDHYTVRFDPDLKTAKFTGEETIDIRVVKPTSEITLNAAELQVSGDAEQGGAKQTATVTSKEKEEMTVLTFAKPLAAGPAKLHLTFSGDMANKLRGLYLSKTKTRNYATTQFEPTDARRAFPSFDEPALKATFDISVVADAGDTAISNAKIASDKPAEAGRHLITFERSPKMSTYLVALMVGDFKCIGADAEGTPVRVCSVPGREQYMKYALDQSVGILKFYNKCYGIKYPFGKLDHIAIPDFEAGAMENTAAITYRETALLIEPNAPEDRKREVAEVIAHEMAHQWFGDLVTMQWWNDIWLNEGFATWMETKPVAAMHPEWNMAEEDALSATEAMRTDSLSNTRPIRQAATTSGEINELFDGIAYNKTAAVLRMIESYIGTADFQKGINAYLGAHKYANATAEDFWGALAHASGKPADKVMQSFVTQPGVPLIMFGQCKGGAEEVSQSRFEYSKTEKDAAQVWTVPVCAGGKCTMMTTPKATVGCGNASSFNTNGTGYYRAEYEPTPANLSAATNAKGPEQVWFADNEWSLAYSGRHPITAYLKSVEGLAKSQSRGVWDMLNDRLDFVSDHVVTDAARAPFDTWAQSVLKPAMTQIGWQVKPSDTPELKDTRSFIFLTLGVAARDEEAGTKARELTEAYMANPSSVDPSLVGSAFRVAAFHGDATLYDEFAKQMEAAKSPGEHNRYMRALSQFRDPALLERTLKLAMTDEVRSQDAPRMITGVMRNPAGRQLAWQFVRSNWDAIKKKSSVWSASTFVNAAASLCDSQQSSQMQQFFQTAQLPGAERTLRQSVERNDQCSQFRQTQQPALANYLEKSGGEHAGASLR